MTPAGASKSLTSKINGMTTHTHTAGIAGAICGALVPITSGRALKFLKITSERRDNTKIYSVHATGRTSVQNTLTWRLLDVPVAAQRTFCMSQYLFSWLRLTYLSDQYGVIWCRFRRHSGC